RVLNFLKEQKLAYRTDPSNKEKRFTRNRVRNELLPYLEKNYNPQIRQALLRLAKIYEEEKKFIKAAAKKVFQEATIKERHGLGLKLSVLRKAPLAVQREVLRMVCVRWDKSSLNFDMVGRLLSSIHKPDKFSISKERFADSKRTGIMWFYGATKGPRPINLGYPLKTSVKANGVLLRSQKIPRRRLKSLLLPDGYEAYLDAERLYPPLILRPVQQGDRFIPLGMKAPKKVGDFFTDAKVPIFQRRNALLLTSAGKICWIVGHRIAEDFKVGPDTKVVLYLKAKPNGR
ncbi:MAG TPA: tRNA lysidine(34) synthetase TilS, partial [candidate division Zixibacteria bacterium]|nr:tRNA lysidine(34) synthetase TilS [candidate division Zixibacteria bacterium]